MTLEDMREFIPDLLNKYCRQRKAWRNLDAASVQTAAAWPLIVSKFNDPEVHIKIPYKWDSEMFRERLQQ